MDEDRLCLFLVLGMGLGGILTNAWSIQVNSYVMLAVAVTYVFYDIIEIEDSDSLTEADSNG